MLKNKKILIVGSYPIKFPKHGGQKRTSAIVSEYKKHFKHVKYISVFPGDYYLERDKYDFKVSGITMKLIRDYPIFNDVLCGMAIEEDNKLRSCIRSFIEKYRPDIIQLEQPYVYIGLKSLFSEIFNVNKPLLVNSTQNIETNLKKDIYGTLDLDKNRVNSYLSLITETEKILSKDADINIAVSRADADHLRYKLGAKNIIIAPNGMYRSEVNKEKISNLENKYLKDHIKRIVLFIGSAHQPNFTGFIKMVGKSVGFIPFDTRIVVMGGVSNLIEANIKNDIIEDACFTERVLLLGSVSEEVLSAHLGVANTIILPIVDGGGSNLKTAEALLSGKHIVATSQSFRGYENMLKLPSVHIADNPRSFRQEIIKCLNLDKPKISSAQKLQIDQVLWANTLKPLISKLGDV